MFGSKIAIVGIGTATLGDNYYLNNILVAIGWSVIGKLIVEISTDVSLTL